MSDATIDQGFAAWLRAEQLVVVADSPVSARWQGIGIMAAAPSPFATSPGAAAEAQRRLAWAGPLAIDRAVVPGERRDLIGRCILLKASARYGYAPAGEAVLVVAVDEQDNNTSVLKVLRRLI